MNRKKIHPPPAPVNPKATGTVQQRSDSWYGRVSLDGSRPWVPLGDVADTSEARAREKLAALIETGNREGNLAELVARVREVAGWKAVEAPKAPKGATTVRDLAEAWTEGDLLKTHGHVNGLREKKSVDSDRIRLGQTFDLRSRGEGRPVFGSLAVADVTEQDIEAVMAACPATWTETTRLQRYAVLARLFDLAIMPARLRKDNPVSTYLRPNRGKLPLFCYLFPSELLAVLTQGKVPLGRRIFYVLGCYTGLRKSSLYALRWVDVDTDNRTLVALVVKNGVPQMFEISEDLALVLSKWRDMYPDESHVVHHTACSRGQEAVTLREDLRLAGITREVLFTDDDPRIEPLRFHDLRASFTSWAYRAGKSDGWISDRTGHLEPKMLERYKRAARTLADLQIVPFPDLSNALPELSTGTVHGRDINDLGRSKRGRRRPKSRQNTQKVRGSRGLWIQSSRVRSPLLTPENVGDRDQAGPTVDSTVDSDSGGSPPLSDPLARAREHLAASVQELVKAGRGADAIALLQAAGSFNAKPAEPEPEPVVDELAARRSRRGAP